jgi:hypothetical protein
MTEPEGPYIIGTPSIARPTVHTVNSRGLIVFKVIDADEIVLDLTLVEALNLAIALIENAGTVASRTIDGAS